MPGHGKRQTARHTHTLLARHTHTGKSHAHTHTHTGTPLTHSEGLTHTCGKHADVTEWDLNF